jgi:GT2 family glycosyltransferase
MQQHSNKLQFAPACPTRPGWYEILVDMQDYPVVSAHSLLRLEIKSHPDRESSFYPFTVTKNGLHTFFHVSTSIIELSLHFSINTIVSTIVRPHIRKCSAAYAITSIIHIISKRDNQHGIDVSRIYRKSYARFRKHGYPGFLKRLLKEYHLADTYLISEEDIYQRWIAGNETGSLKKQSMTLKGMTFQPVISVIMATWRSNLRWLEAAIQSVESQSYPHWELCIADDASNDPDLTQFLQRMQAKGPRIKVIFRPQRGHISAAQNSALELANGDYVAFLDHDDLLAKDAILHIVETLQTKPRPRLLYSDEDKVDGLGRRVRPHFKSKWNYDLLLSQNYITHLMVVERKLVQDVGGFRVGLEGSQDHDLAIRIAEHLPANLIHHIPHILYHWRITEGSTALHAGAKSYTEDAGLKALQDHFVRIGQRNVQAIKGILPNTYRPTYPLPEPKPLVSLLIPTRDKLELLQPCIRSILNKTDYPDYEIVILDNGSVEPETHAFFNRICLESPNVRVLPYNFPFNYSAINNFGVKHARGSIIGLVNNDIEVISPGWLTEMTSHANRPDIGCVGAKLYFSDGTLQHAGVILGIGGVAGHSHKHFPGDAHGYFNRLKVPQNLSAVTGACLVVRKDVYEKVGGLDEENLKVAFNDVDFCLKVREAGYRNLWTPFAELYHHESKSRGHEDTPEKQARFEKEVLWMKKKWGSNLTNDPYYSPNLTLDQGDFSFKLTPFSVNS